MFFSENILKKVETHSLPMSFGTMEISFKCKSLTSLSDSKRYSCLRCAYFASVFTPLLSKISSIFSVNHKLRVFFQ